MTLTISRSTSCPKLETLLLLNPLSSVTDHVPFGCTVVSFSTVLFTVTLIFAPTAPLPVNVLSVDNIRLSVVVPVTVGASGLTFTETFTILEERKAALFPVSEEGNVTLTR